MISFPYHKWEWWYYILYGLGTTQHIILIQLWFRRKSTVWNTSSVEGGIWKRTFDAQGWFPWRDIEEVSANLLSCMVDKNPLQLMRWPDETKIGCDRWGQNRYRKYAQLTNIQCSRWGDQMRPKSGAVDERKIVEVCLVDQNSVRLIRK